MTHDPNHDPECLLAYPTDRYLPCICGRLARVRADERDRAAERVAAALAAGLATSSDGALYYIELDEDDPSCGYDVTFPKDSLVAAARGDNTKENKNG